jgi:ribosomal-protein-alanine N-acetyltransferase
MIRIEKAQTEDIISVKNIETECVLSSWALRDYYEELVRTDSLFYTAKVNNLTVGFILARLIINNNLLDEKFRDDFGCIIEIYNIAVKPEYRRKSIAELLLQKILGAGQKNKVKEIFLEVRKSNSNAINFYRKHKFQIIGERKNFYENPRENALLMSRQGFFEKTLNLK